MTKRTRTILFLICVFLFISVAPIIVLYSQGFRFDFGLKKFTQTGGFFVKAEPKQVEIFIDGKLIKKTDFFFGSALIENLIPKKYKIRLEKTGYSPWEKVLEIKEKGVTEVKNIVLFPQNPNFTILTKDVENFWFSPDERKIILKEGGEEGWALKLYDLEKNLKSHLINEKDIYQKGVDLLNLDFSKDEKEIYLEIGMKEQLKNFTLRYDKIPPTLAEKATTTIPKDIITYSEQDARYVGRTTRYRELNNNIYYLDNLGYIYRADNTFSPQERINQIAFLLKQETEYKLEIFSNYIFIKEEQNLYLFNPEAKSFEKFFEPIKDFKISPDNKKIVYFSDYEIWILFLEDASEQPQRKIGEKLFLTRFSEKIGDIFWLNQNYLTFNVGNKIKVSEIDERDKINIYDLNEFNEPRIFFNKTDEKLYILTKNNFYSSINLLP